MCGGGLGVGLNCKQQIDDLIFHLVWKETGFFVVGERHTFPIQKSQSISALSWDAPPLGEQSGYAAVNGGGAETLPPVFHCLFRSHLNSSPLSSLATSSFVASKVSQSLCLPPIVL